MISQEEMDRLSKGWDLNGESTNRQSMVTLHAICLSKIGAKVYVGYGSWCAFECSVI